MFYIFNTHLDTIVSKTHFLNGNHIGMANIACKNCIFCFVLKLKSNKILTLGKVGFQSEQITAASWSGNTCQPSNQLIITLIRLLFGAQLFILHCTYNLRHFYFRNGFCFLSLGNSPTLSKYYKIQKC